MDHLVPELQHQGPTLLAAYHQGAHGHQVRLQATCERQALWPVVAAEAIEGGVEGHAIPQALAAREEL